MSLRLGAVAITFLLCTVPLFGSPAHGTEAGTEAGAEASAKALVDVVSRESMASPKSASTSLLGADFLAAQEQTQRLDQTAVSAESKPDATAPDAAAPDATAPDAAVPAIAGKSDLQKLSTVNGLPCLRDLGQDECMLTYAYRAIEFHAIGEEVIARFLRLNGTVNDDDVIVMSSHIEDAALNDRINLDDSPVIFAQFQQLSGARYEIPKTASEIKRSLGFSEDTPIAAVDWFEILKVHLERTLSTTPTVSDLILDLLGVELNPVVVETN